MVSSDLQAVIFVALLFSVTILNLIILRLVWTKIWKEPAVLRASVLLFLLFGAEAAISASVFLTPPQKDFTRPTTYTYEPLNSANPTTNLTRADQLHKMLTQSGIHDPLGLMFADYPSNHTKERNIQVDPAKPYYRLKNKNLNIPTLIQVPINWLQNFTLLKVKAETFLQIPPENASRIKLYVYQNGSVFDSRVNLKIRVTDVKTNDIALVLLSYNLKTGFADMVNLIYAGNVYNPNKTDKLYAGSVYTLSTESFIRGLSFLFTFLFGGVAVFSLMIFPLAHRFTPATKET